MCSDMRHLLTAPVCRSCDLKLQEWGDFLCVERAWRRMRWRGQVKAFPHFWMRSRRRKATSGGRCLPVIQRSGQPLLSCCSIRTCGFSNGLESLRSLVYTACLHLAKLARSSIVLVSVYLIPVYKYQEVYYVGNTVHGRCRG